MVEVEIDTYDADDGESVTEMVITLDNTEFVVSIPGDNPENPELYERDIGDIAPSEYHTTEGLDGIPVADE